MDSNQSSASPPLFRLRSEVTRREFMLTLGASAAAACLSGCGDDNGSVASPSTSVGRTVVSGSLTNQVNQFSLASEQIGNIWEGQSPALSALKAFAAGTGSSSRAVGSDTRVMLQSVWYSLYGLRSGYERLANGLLADDDQGQVAEAVTTNNSLSGTSSLNNPQWLAAMMLQNYCAFRVTGALMKIVQIAGIQQMQDWVMAQTGTTEKLIAYGILADVFNAWVDTLQQSAAAPSLTAFKLDVSSAATPATIIQKIAGIPALLDAIPYAPGYRTGGKVTGIPDDATITGAAAANFALSFLGSLAKITLTSGPIVDTFPQSVDPTKAKYDLTARLGSTGLGPQIAAAAGSAAAAQTTADTLVAALMATVLPAADSSAASCLVQIAVGAYNLIVAVAQVILSDHSLVGDAIAGEQALQQLNTEISTIKACGSLTQLKILASVACDITYLQSTYLIGGNVVALRNVPVTNIPSAVETDQIRDTLTLLCSNKLCFPLANAGWNGKPNDGTIDLFRRILAGLSPIPGAPRTFNNAEISAAGLFYDLLRRNAVFLKPDYLTTGQLIFCTSNFARLLRRSPGATSAKLPSITAAALLCSAPNFTPSRSDGPVNLLLLPAMGPLSPATDIVPGVPVHVQ